MSEEVIAKISQGQLRGKKIKSAAGGECYSFYGIPYAKSPLGPLRFRPPEPAEPWEGIRDATKEGTVLPYKMLQPYGGNEDSLFLNVCTPEWPVKHSKPVMVSIHGGGFVIGSGNREFAAPDFLVAEDVIVVTFNYRLGALGFLNLEGSDVTTNNGLRDQVLALTWVKENIMHFGGDPGNVTIFGISAGGCSVHALMLSPLAEGLFHRAIAMSGVAFLPICFLSHEVSKQRSLRLAKMLGCTSDDPQQIADFLRTVPAEEIVTNQSAAMSDKDKLRLLTFSFTPTEEIHEGRFFPEHPLKLLEKGNFLKVPFIIGMESAEGGLGLLGGDGRPLSLSELNKNMDLVVPQDLAIEIGTERSKKIAKNLKNFYLGDRPIEASIEHYVEMASDLLFAYPISTAAKLHLKNSNSPLYVYVFDHETPREFQQFPDLKLKAPGSSHGDDSLYIYFTPMKPNIFPHDSAEEKVRSHIVKYWTQFAKTGDVSHIPSKLAWLPATKDMLRYLRIRENLTLETDMFKKRMEFLDNLYSTFKRVYQDTADH